MDGLVPCLTSKVAEYNGRPALFINDKPAAAAMVFVEPKYVRSFAEAGLHIYNPDLSFTDWWLGVDEYDMSAVDARLQDYIAGDPDILLIPRIAMGYAEAKWWREKFPDEIAIARSIDTGARVDRFGEGASHRGSGHSFASKIWLKEAEKAIRAIVEHIEGSDYAGHVAGYHIGGGITTEWFSWNAYHFDLCEDYSLMMGEYFRAWLANRYPNDDALREAWQDDVVLLATAMPPEPARMVGYDGGYLRDDRRAVDYLECHSDAIVSALRELTSAAKESCGRKKVVGVFFGYAWPHRNNANPARTGHVMMKKVFSLPDVDFIISPYHYDNRALGGYNGPQSLPDAIAANGKLYVSEIDTITSVIYEQERKRRIHHFGPMPKSVRESVEILARDFAAAAHLRAGYWWMDVLQRGAFDNPEIMMGIAEFRRIEDELFAMPWKSAAEVAVVFSPESCLHQRLLNSMPHWYLSVLRQWGLARMGLPFETVLIDDLLEGKTKSYRLLIFPNCYYLSDNNRRLLRRILENRRISALWFHAPGYLSDTGKGVDYCSELTGIKLREAGGSVKTASFLRSSDPMLKDIRGGVRFGIGVDQWEIDRLSVPGRSPLAPDIEPVIVADDDNAQVFARLEGLGLPGLVCNRSMGRVDVFSLVPAPPWRFLRNLAAECGAHVWCKSGDVIYADNRFVALHATTKGQKRIMFPYKVDVVDLRTGERFGEGLDFIEFEAAKGETKIFGIRQS